MSSLDAAFLDKYLQRVGIDDDDAPLPTNYETLAKIMEAQSRSIPFENIDVVCGKTISIVRSDIARKLIDEQRGGYCWELNALLQMALEALGFDVTPLMCRVRWNKPSDADGPVSTYTHMALRVVIGGKAWLADVGFSGVNSIAPVELNHEVEQELPEGTFRVSREGDYSALQLSVKGAWSSLYKWRDEPAAYCDQEAANWYSCTFPAARFTTSFFVCRVVGHERHHILNGEYCVREGHGADRTTMERRIIDEADLRDLLATVFGLRLAADGAHPGLGRYLTK
ncbi:N-acetyltransferase [Aureococcus anophagefferens]|nr:N-acetyltransferase [Aureococcus anophagefferens]